MKRFGAMFMVLAGFITGIAFVYSCGGGGSSSGAATVEELEDRVAVLEAKLANIVINNNPIYGLSGPHFIFSGMNIHVRNGAGLSGTVNGVGNIIVGYNEPYLADTTKRTGSHNLVIGERHEYSRFNGLVAGMSNRLEGDNSTVTGGRENAAIGWWSTVAGGRLNEASGNHSSITGGHSNDATTEYTSVTGGTSNVAGHFYATVSGGAFNQALSNFSSVSGGRYNIANGQNSSVSGGYMNSTDGYCASISGGNGNSAGASYQSDAVPDYDSGWNAVALNDSIDFVHNLGGNVDHYTVVLEQKDTDGSSSIHNQWHGGDVYYVGATEVRVGSFFVDLTASSVTVWRNPTANYTDQVRIKIWVDRT